MSRWAGIAAVVLAGGRSRRMGRDKALVPVPAVRPGDVDGEPLVARVCRAVAAACDPVYLICARQQDVPELPHVRVVRDVLDHGGPLPALHLGLSAIAPTEPGRALVTAIDLPRLTPELICALAHAGPDDVAVEEGGRAMPLPIVLSKLEAKAAAARLVASGEGRLRALVEALAPRRVTRAALLADEALRAVDPELLGLEDADDAAALARLTARVT